jgi:hypothetical protein
LINNGPSSYGKTDNEDQVPLQGAPVQAAAEQVPLLEDARHDGLLLRAQLCGGAAAVNQLLEVALEVRPTDLAAEGQQHP